MNDRLTYDTLLKNKNDLELDFLKQTDSELWIRLFQIEKKIKRLIEMYPK